MLVCMCVCVTMFLIPRRGSTFKSYSIAYTETRSSRDFTFFFLDFSSIVDVALLFRLGLIFQKKLEKASNRLVDT